MRFLDKVVVITGAAKGIGSATAKAFANEGARIVVADIDTEAGVSFVKLLNEQRQSAIFVKCDVSKKNEVLNLFEQTVKHFGTVDITVNCAGVNHSTDFLAMREEEWDHVIGVDLKGTFLVSQAAAELMVCQQKPGVIVNVSSVMSVLAMSDQVAYCAAKGAINQLTKAMALALVDKGIRVNACAPGPVLTELMEFAISQKGKYEKLIERMPIGRIASCEEIAKVILFLASNDASFFVGQTIYPDGGRIIQAFPKEFE